MEQPWTRAEDEVLRVGVMKYGLHQWARISSLLPRRSARQCRARFDDALDPRIRTAPWGAAEDARLLALAAALPAQWGTIAEVLVGRTAGQCAARHEQLLAEKGNSIAGAPIRLDAPAEDPEAAAALAAQDDDMLAEATARVAHDGGRKARRRARQALLDAEADARALARAGRDAAAPVRLAPGGSRKGRLAQRDYGAAVPFERRAPEGLHGADEASSGQYEAAAELRRAQRMAKLSAQSAPDPCSEGESTGASDSASESGSGDDGSSDGKGTDTAQHTDGQPQSRAIPAPPRPKKRRVPFDAAAVQAAIAALPAPVDDYDVLV